MNQRIPVTATVLGLLLAMSISLMAQGGFANRNGMAGNGPCAACTTAPVSSQTLTDAEKTWLLFLREEEKLARDVYLFLYDANKLNIFANIAKSEQRHFDAIGNLIKRYGLEDPASTEAGVFSNADLQEAYNTLTKQGLVSVVEALKVGVAIELKDIEDLTAALGKTSRTDIIRVYSNLLNGSEKHLAAFESHLQVLGVNP
ncbi:MAG: DUF2202 domain-containing protein [Acidobacteria bacterium]|nr:DUF2202 domain-containing protein [Acidobacteriota bacterium]